MQEIAPGIFTETIYPGVTLGALILPHGTILIDAPLRMEDARAWRAALINQGSSTNRVLVNLDAHPDRTLGARAMECMIIAHQKTAQVFRSRPSVFKGQNAESGAEWEAFNDTMGTRWATPDITFNQRIFLHWGPPDVELDNHPGTMAGAVWAVVPALKIIFVGDTVVYDQPPFVGSSDIPAWIESLDLLQKSYKGYTIVSGRGGVVPFEAIKKQITFLKNVIKGLERLSKRSASVDALDSLIPGLLSGMEFPAHLEDQYKQRLRYGLSQYYVRRYRPSEGTAQTKSAENEQ